MSPSRSFLARLILWSRRLVQGRRRQRKSSSGACNTSEEKIANTLRSRSDLLPKRNDAVLVRSKLRTHHVREAIHEDDEPMHNLFLDDMDRDTVGIIISSNDFYPVLSSKRDIRTFFGDLVQLRSASGIVDVQQVAKLASKIARVLIEIPYGIYQDREFEAAWIQREHLLDLRNPISICGYRHCVAQVHRERIGDRDVALYHLEWDIYVSDDRAKAHVAARAVKAALLHRNLQHKNLVPFLGLAASAAWTRRGHLCAISLWMPNGPIITYLSARRDEPIPLLPLLVDVAEGIDYLHSNGIAHGRPMTSDDILIDNEGHARISAPVHSQPFDTYPYGPSGDLPDLPPRYAAPEIGMELADKYPIDIFSFARLCLHIYTLKFPFPEEISEDRIFLRLRFGTLQQPARPLPEKCPFGPPSDDMWALMERCWAQEPATRPTADQVVDLLKGVSCGVVDEH